MRLSKIFNLRDPALLGRVMRCGMHPFPTPVLTGSGSRVNWRTRVSGQLTTPKEQNEV